MAAEKGEKKQGSTGVKHPRETLTEKQQAFARLIVEGKTQTDAYLGAYDPKPGIKKTSLDQLAHRVIVRPLVKAEIAALRLRASRHCLLSLNDRLKILAERIQNPKAKDSDVASLTSVYSRISGDQAPDRQELSAPGGGPIELIVAKALPIVRRLSAEERLEELRRARADRLAPKAAAEAIENGS